jgi:hypothetical protein
VFAVGVVLLVEYQSWTSDLNAYRGATACASPGDALLSKSCLFSAQAGILTVHRNNALVATVRFDALSDHTFSTSFPTNREPTGSALVAGGSAPAVLWNGRITDLAGEPTVDNPQDRPIDQFRNLAPFFAVMGLLILFGSTLMARAAWRPRQKAAR